MHFDQLQKFAKCLVNNGNGTYSVQFTAGSSTGSECHSNKASDIMKAFDKTISANAVRGT